MARSEVEEAEEVPTTHTQPHHVVSRSAPLHPHELGQGGGVGSEPLHYALAELVSHEEGRTMSRYLKVDHAL